MKRIESENHIGPKKSKLIAALNRLFYGTLQLRLCSWPR